MLNKKLLKKLNFVTDPSNNIKLSTFVDFEFYEKAITPGHESTYWMAFFYESPTLSSFFDNPFLFVNPFEIKIKNITPLSIIEASFNVEIETKINFPENILELEVANFFHDDASLVNVYLFSDFESILKIYTKRLKEEYVKKSYDPHSPLLTKSKRFQITKKFNELRNKYGFDFPELFI